MTIETLTSREAYLAYRAQWKAQYKALSIEIRQTKHALANAFRESNYSAAYRAQRDLLASRALATRMLEQLAEAKAFAKAQRELHIAQAKAA